MKKFLKEFVKRLMLPTVYAPIVGFIITVLVASGIINIGEDNISKLVELIVQVIGGLLTAFGVANNNQNKKGF